MYDAKGRARHPITVRDQQRNADGDTVNIFGDLTETPSAEHPPFDVRDEQAVRAMAMVALVLIGFAAFLMAIGYVYSAFTRPALEGGSSSGRVGSAPSALSTGAEGAFPLRPSLLCTSDAGEAFPDLCVAERVSPRLLCGARSVRRSDCAVGQRSARVVHTHEVAGSNPASATCHC